VGLVDPTSFTVCEDEVDVGEDIGDDVGGAEEEVEEGDSIILEGSMDHGGSETVLQVKTVGEDAGGDGDAGGERCAIKVARAALID
jgi:hypothetical protein